MSAADFQGNANDKITFVLSFDDDIYWNPEYSASGKIPNQPRMAFVSIDSAEPPTLYISKSETVPTGSDTLQFTITVKNSFDEETPSISATVTVTGASGEGYDLHLSN